MRRDLRTIIVVAPGWRCKGIGQVGEMDTVPGAGTG